MVENFRAWGTESEADIYMATLETIGSDNRLGLWHVTLGGYRQEVAFSDLVDKRGNNLPTEIKQPTVVVLPRECRSAYIKTHTGNTGFIIAKSDNDSPSVTVDLLVFETGI